ncbi:MAG: DEAD/DEAH box helicase [Bacteroidetes bacterium]|jgi:superfamily II DNA/RNA helicase|nr:DEAD/DEAH box helicase [Bacteroidota bacterium]MBT3747998.1 DEAD/DEAH box helicase [Bacteroidota bacterium]MBT4400620.1 DEAD/DEAH box helicase [Bacteroidota bacterium]MBT4408372.1 DEAD/DEAH box helicase [Bacteroidota bacterium]MBT4969296.1 DEAD/DEAH box helicase [Bacteroidota bacterium]
MSKTIIDQKEISDNELTGSFLNKFEITALNPMQEEACKTIRLKSDVVLLSPTGTGKTLAFLIPLIETLDMNNAEIQILILVPSRELAQQIEQVTRKMGSGFKVNAVYGGRSGTLDKIDLKHRPAILIGTPGRIADRIRRDKLPLEHIETLVLDEFDKSLEIGFEKEMTEIVEGLPNVKQRILTSATSDVKIPEFVGLKKPEYIDYLHEGISQLTIKTLLSADKDKLKALEKTLAFIGHQPGIIFCNFKDALERVSNFLCDNHIHHECFHGGMEQIDRERALIKFRNGANQLLLATDLAARGLDIPEIKFILHYHLPPRNKEFTHRNGRTARMNRNGIAYILHWKEEELPDYIKKIAPEKLNIEDQQKAKLPSPVKWLTLYITGGRRDKISKGDIAGLFLKQGQIQKHQLGVIELKQNCAYAGVHAEIAEMLIEKTNNSKLKKKKVRISLI